MIGLEYLLLFGVPENKIETYREDRTQVSLAFPERRLAEQHHRHWKASLSRWQGKPVTAKGGQGQFSIHLRNCRVDLLLPINWSLYFNSHDRVWKPPLWPGRVGDPAPQYGLNKMHLGFNLDRAFGHRVTFGHTELMLTPDSMVAPAAYAFAPDSFGGLVQQHYYQGVPRLIVEVLTPAAEQSLRGPKMQLYREAGVEELWLLDPNQGRVEVYRLFLGRYAQEGVFSPGQSFRTLGMEVDPGQLWERARGPYQGEDRWDEGDQPVGLQQLLTAGIPLRNYEFYHGTCPRWLAWDREQDAERHVRGLVEEIIRWEGGGTPGPLPFQLGSFRLQREGSVLRLDVRVDGSVHRRFLDYWHTSGNWR